MIRRSMRESLREEISLDLKKVTVSLSRTVFGSEFQMAGAVQRKALCDCCLGERSAQRRSGRSSSQIVDVLSVLE